LIDAMYRKAAVHRGVVVIALASVGCTNAPPEATRPAAQPRATGSATPRVGLLRTPTGIVEATPEQTVATLRDNCDRATPDNAFAVACFSLGQLYDTGTFVATDHRLAMGLHHRSCSLGEMRACAELGVFYDEGTVVPRDVGLAYKYFRQACDGGNGRGCNNLVFLHPGTASEQDVSYVLGRYRAICEGGGDPEACFVLGDIHRIGELLPSDLQRAVELYAKACDAGHATACNNLGALSATGAGVAKDPARAAELYRRACSLGAREGCVNAGIDPATAAMRIVPRPRGN
jgi:TPR repeat protein